MRRSMDFRTAIAAAMLAGIGLPGGTGMAASLATSAYRTPPADTRAIVVKARGDGRADDGAAIQQAIDAAGTNGNGSIVFLPAGRYRITRSLFLRPGVRLIGVGARRPVILLAAHTPGFARGIATMLIFSGGTAARGGKMPFPLPDAVPADPAIGDANPGTFYSALSNIDFEIGDGNPAAVAVRFHAAQHAFLRHIDFHIGSGLAGLYQVANEAEGLHFFGGRYGILAEKTSPAWQFTLIDARFEGQREAAIREHEAGLTLVNTSIRDTPIGIDIDRGYGDWLWGKDVRFENVSHAAIVISNEDNAYTQIGFDNAVARKVPTFARFRDSGKTVAGAGSTYRVTAFDHGLHLAGLGVPGTYRTTFSAAPLATLPSPPAPAVRALPPVAEWTNVLGLGAKGDGVTDDTAALQAAIDTHRIVYFPTGHYVVTDTLRLKPDSVLIGLHPSLTQIVLPDGTPGFAGIGAPKPLVETAKGGDAIVSGLGLFTGGINPRATALLWKAGAGSLVDDVKIQGGHGTFLRDGTRFDPYNAAHSGDADPGKRWDAQYPSIWVADGGGGTFANIWTPDTYAQAGLMVTNTDTPGHVYELSSEHHVRNEIVLDGVAHWEMLAPQTEEESGEGQDTLSLDIRNSHDVLIANYHAYRVARTVKPAATAVRVTNSTDIRFRNVHVNAESGLATCDANGCGTYLRASKFPFDDAIQDVTRTLAVREREFAVLDVTGTPASPTDATIARPEKLADGFYAISGGAVDAAGTLYFVDHHLQRIYRWAADGGLSIERDNALDPVNLAFDRSGDLLVLSSDGAQGTVYSFKPGTPADQLTIIPPTPAIDRPGAATALPASLWINGEFRDQIDPETYLYPTLAEMFARSVADPKPRDYVSPDGSLVIPAYRAVQQGPPDFRGWRFSDSLDSHGFVAARPGDRVYLSNESEDRTYRGRLGARGSVTDLEPFADRGGESVATAPDGRVFIANGQVFVYAADGARIGRIDVPERPLQLLFGGPKRQTLFILTHHALYAARGPFDR